MTRRALGVPLRKSGKRVDRTREETPFIDGKGRRMVARYCQHCDGKMTSCSQCGGVGIVVVRAAP